MAEGSTWRDRALSVLFRRLSTRLRAQGDVTFGPTESVAAVAARALALKDADYVALSALAPHATDAALALLDTSLGRANREEFFDDDARPCVRPRLLGRSVTVVFAQDDGRALVKVRPAGSAGRKTTPAADHIVLVSGVSVDVEAGGDASTGLLRIGSSVDDDAARGDPYFLCSCRAYEFKHAGEYHCKHVIAAGLAIASNLAAVTTVPDADFIAILAPSDVPPNRQLT